MSRPWSRFPPRRDWAGSPPTLICSWAGRASWSAWTRLWRVRAGRLVVAVHGLGGVGKSTLAARFAHLHADRYAPVWWTNADSSAAIDTGLADPATALAPQTAELPSEQRAELAVRWLAAHDGWLLVLDNLSAPADAAGLLKRIRTGTIVITSRRTP